MTVHKLTESISFWRYLMAYGTISFCNYRKMLPLKSPWPIEKTQYTINNFETSVRPPTRNLSMSTEIKPQWFSKVGDCLNLHIWRHCLLILTWANTIAETESEFGTDTARMGAGSKQNYITGLRLWTSSVKIVALHFCGKVWGSKRCA